MKAVARQYVPVAIEGDGVEVRLQDIGGGMSASFIRLPEGTDLGPALKGLTDDRCQCPHWGYLLRGRLQMRTADGGRRPDVHRRSGVLLGTGTCSRGTGGL
jgi:hypothetical protein